MFESKKWLIAFFALAFVGSIGGSIIAYIIINKKHQQAAPAQVAVTPTPVPAPVVTNNPPPVAVNEVKPAAPPAPVVEDIQPDFPIVSRAQWKAKDPISPMKPHTPSLITIHHTATGATKDKGVAGKLRNLQDFSQRPGKVGDNPKPAWPDVPYHFYIGANGEVGEGRDINFVGDSATDYDATGHILIALEGNFENTQPTREQWDVLEKMISWLTRKYHISADKIKSHKDYVSTACPGKNLQDKMDQVRSFAAK